MYHYNIITDTVKQKWCYIQSWCWHLYKTSQKAAFVSPLISWLSTLQSQRTPIELWRESCTARLAVHYYPICLIERRNIWPIELLSLSKMSLNLSFLDNLLKKKKSSCFQVRKSDSLFTRMTNISGWQIFSTEFNGGPPRLRCTTINYQMSSSSLP